ncbi:MAG: chemotaxis protein CheW [Methanoregula sp.]|jgi:chemotaxis signal transduction protein|nr:chemotaxis protein CheW [Methanoregula sp.]
MMHHLLFSVDHVRCALPLTSVRIVLQMVQLGPAPESRAGLAGTVNLHGQIIPVLSVRPFFTITDRAPRLTDKLIIAQTGQDCVALWVDETHVIQQSPVLPAPAESVEKSQPVVPGLDLTADGTYFFVDLSRFLEQGIAAVPGPQAWSADPHGGRYTMTAIREPGTAEEELVQRTLEDRAKKIAVPEAGGIEAGIVEVLRFQLAYQEYALEMRYVREVILTGEITPVPGAPPFISGICAARGQIISLMDLRVLFSLKEKGLTDLNRVIVITDGHITFGILADNITGIGTIPSFLILMPDSGMAPSWKQYLKGYVSSSLIVLDAAAILADPALVVEDI